MRKIITVYVFFLLGLTGQLNAQPIIEIKDPKTFRSVGTDVNIYVDESGRLTIQEMLSAENLKKFAPSKQKIPNIGITNATLWCQLKINNKTAEDCYLDLMDAAPDSIAIYELLPGDSIKQIAGGNYIPFKNRELRVNNYLFKICGQTDADKTFFVKIKHSRGTQFPVSIGTLKGILEQQHTDDFFQGIYFGVMLLMVLYNLCIYFSLQDSSYIYYVVYGTFMILLNAVLSGYAFEYLWPNWVELNKLQDIITSCLGISGILFAMNFLQIKKYFPFMHRLFYMFLLVFAVCIVLILIGQYLPATFMVEAASFLLIICLFITAFYVLRRGYQPAKFFLFAWSILLLGASIYILKDFDIIPYNSFTALALQFGSALEAILLSFALADKINIAKREEIRMQELLQTELLNNQIVIKQQTMEYIGREIHDNIGQKLVLASIYAQRMEYDNHFPDSLPQIQEVSNIINDSLTELRNLSKSLVDSKLESSSLAELVQVEIEKVNHAGVCQINYELDKDAVNMTIVVKSYLLRIIQEFIQNSIKHAACQKISIKMYSDATGLFIEAEDDGKGFDKHSQQSHGIGIHNMEWRMKILGGTFSLESEIGKGVSMHLFMPTALLNKSII